MTNATGNTMSLSKQDINKVAHLARLAIDDQHCDKYAIELSNTFDLIAQLKNIDTENVTPMAHPVSCVQRLRADDVTEVDQRDKFQTLAPAVEAGLYLVPKVIE